MSGERDVSPHFDGFEPLSFDLEPLDRRLRHDSERWQGLVPATSRLDALARTLAATLAEPARPLSSDTPRAASSNISTVRPIPFRPHRAQNLLAIVAMMAIVSLLGALLIGLAHRGPNPPSPATAPTATPTSTPTLTPTAAPFTVTRVDLSVNPTSIAGKSCGTAITVTYTATFHLPPNGPGGAIHFAYTVNNGRGTTMASVTAAPGQTTVRYSFSWSGALPADHTYPEPGGVIVQSPNAVSSPLLGPSGRCG